MSRDEDRLGATLEALVLPYEGDSGDWDDVLHRAEAGRSPGRRWVGVAAVAVLASICAVVLADPFGGEQKGVLDRALAAVGNGPVLHVVTRTEVGGTLVDLDSGRRTRLRARSDTWFDPRSGSRTTVRLRGRVLADYRAPAGRRIRFVPGALEVFTRDYRASLRSGGAHVLRKGELRGTPVYWIRVEGGPPGVRGSPCSRLFCSDVAVSRETYKPLYVRRSPGPGPGEWILKVESLPDGAGEIRGKARTSNPGFTFLPRRTVDRPAAARLLKGKLAWPGRRIAKLELARMLAVGERPFRYSGRMRRPRYGPRNRVIQLLFGDRRDIDSGSAPRTWKRALVVNEARRPTYGVSYGPVRVRPTLRIIPPIAYVPSEGQMLLAADGRQAILRHGGLVVGLLGSSPALVRAAVRALRR
jgi:hypothetical protein